MSYFLRTLTTGLLYPAAAGTFFTTLLFGLFGHMQATPTATVAVLYGLVLSALLAASFVATCAVDESEYLPRHAICDTIEAILIVHLYFRLDLQYGGKNPDFLWAFGTIGAIVVVHHVWEFGCTFRGADRRNRTPIRLALIILMEIGFIVELAAPNLAGVHALILAILLAVLFRYFATFYPPNWASPDKRLRDYQAQTDAHLSQLSKRQWRQARITARLAKGQPRPMSLMRPRGSPKSGQ